VTDIFREGINRTRLGRFEGLIERPLTKTGLTSDIPKTCLGIDLFAVPASRSTLLRGSRRINGNDLPTHLTCSTHQFPVVTVHVIRPLNVGFPVVERTHPSYALLASKYLHQLANLSSVRLEFPRSRGSGRISQIPQRRLLRRIEIPPPRSLVTRFLPPSGLRPQCRYTLADRSVHSQLTRCSMMPIDVQQSASFGENVNCLKYQKCCPCPIRRSSFNNALTVDNATRIQTHSARFVLDQQPVDRERRSLPTQPLFHSRDNPLTKSIAFGPMVE